ncbi:MAG: cytochrome-c peroxidase [Kofleriaceae bacterium]|nr:cytochrome-c peroxidase [Kofleriaceae bacterium]
MIRPTHYLLLALAVAGCKASDKGEDVNTTPAEEIDKPDTLATTPGAEIADAGLPTLPKAPALPKVPSGLPDTPSPDYNPTTANKVALGRLLFSDSQLAAAESGFSCGSCHQESKGFASGISIDKTASGTLNQRHTPTLRNIGYHTEFYWDGRTKPLESHILGHWMGQLGLDPKEATAVIAADPAYRAHFLRAFGGKPSPDRAAEAIASYLRTIRTGDSAWDKYEAGQADAVSADAIAGALIFNERAGCATCHQPPLYTDLGYHSIKAVNRSAADVGRFGTSSIAADKGAFKTPSLRALATSAPYFHNGGAANLGEVLDAKEASGSPRLSPIERRQLLAFLQALN